ncbi:hypothetical protein ACVWXL_008371 [Bradyrhizobium sp. GM22.5]
MIAEAVERFEPEQNPRDPPVVSADKILDSEGVHGAVHERGKRTASFRNERRRAMERFPVAEIGVEIEIGFAVVAEGSEIPGHAGQPLDLLIGRLAVDGFARDRVRVGEARRPDLEIGPITLVFAFQTLE